jgi:SpoVK/Ycf46/Vps4 family AAA+-type ATPase
VPSEIAAEVDFARLVSESDGLTPADIEYAARRASQEALARALASGVGRRPEERAELTTSDYLAALSVTRATVSEEQQAAFLEDIDDIARL